MADPIPDIINIRRAIAERDRELRLLRAIDRAMTRYRVTSLPTSTRREVDDRSTSRSADMGAAPEAAQ